MWREGRSGFGFALTSLFRAVSGEGPDLWVGAVRQKRRLVDAAV